MYTPIPDTPEPRQHVMMHAYAKSHVQPFQ